MSVYEQARRHAWFMAGALVFSTLFVLVVDRLWGHSTIAFGIAIVALVLANARMLGFSCPSCGKNLFFRGIFVVPWPNRICSKCGTMLDRAGNDV